jgi:predicted 3-demethylubiquinone-9 3-methyltransferase (glyoxalase superfamily)
VSGSKNRPFRMFTGEAEEAMNFYVSLLHGAEVLSIVRHGANGPGVEGSVMNASFRIGKQTVMCTDR